jgi:hypothetical protein
MKHVNTPYAKDVLMVHKVTTGLGAFNCFYLMPEVIASNFLVVQKYMFYVSCFEGKGSIFEGEFFIFCARNFACCIEFLI